MTKNTALYLFVGVFAAQALLSALQPNYVWVIIWCGLAVLAGAATELLD